MNDKESLLLQNDLLQVRFLPSFGGKIASLRSVRTGEEFLLPPLKPYRHVKTADGFDAGDGGGFDECLPSVSSCEGIAGESPVPDHGDLWRLFWDVDSQGESVTLHAEAASRPLRLTRRATLQEASLVLNYELLNQSDAPATWLWSAHPLLLVDAGDRIVLPSEIKKVTVEYSKAGIFSKDSSIAWPTAESVSEGVIDLSKVGRKDGTTAHKLFARPDTTGWGALYRLRIGQGLVLRFSPAELPFLGLWICSGAWPETGDERQYTVALEPTTSNSDSLTVALRNGTARTLGARESCRWQLEIQLLGASATMSFPNFCTQASSSTPTPISGGR